MERRGKARGLLALVSTTVNRKKRMEFVNRVFNAAINLRRSAGMDRRLPAVTRESIVGQPLKLELYKNKWYPQ